MSDEPRHLVHLAAAAIRVKSVIRQRCAWCGALIDEHDLERIAWQDDGSGQNPLIDEDGTPRERWAGLVAVVDGNPTMKWAVDHPDDHEVPPDSCMALDPRVTA